MEESNGDEFIGTTATPAGGFASVAEARQSWDYYHGMPYPAHAFGPVQWPRNRGPVPTAIPYVRILVDECAKFLFRGGPPLFSVPDDDKASGFLADVIKANRLSARWIPLGILAGNTGTIAAKFAHIPESPNGPVKISFLSCPEECRVWVDPHDNQRLLMARIQYPYRDTVSSKWFYYREEWTAGRYVVYKPKFAGAAALTSIYDIPQYATTFGDGEGWEIDTDSTNPLGVIPVTLIKNRAVEGVPLGVGDLWGLFRLMDRIALTLHGEDRHNQLFTDPATVYKNADITNADPLQPGEAVSVKNDSEGKDADVKILEVTGAVRQWVAGYYAKIEELCYKAAGISLVDPAAITNKGNLTRLALMTAYQSTIGTCDCKRLAWGESGMKPFFENMLVGLANLGSDEVGGIPELAGINGYVEVSCEWGDYFSATDDDVQNQSNRTIGQVQAGVLPRDRAAERLARAEGVPEEEIPDLIAELPTPGGLLAPITDDTASQVGTDSDGHDSSGEGASELADAMSAGSGVIAGGYMASGSSFKPQYAKQIQARRQAAERS